MYKTKENNEKAPQIISNVVIFQKAFFLNSEKTITSRGPNPAINTPSTESPAPAFNCKNTPTKGANIQINQDTKFGLVPLEKIVRI